MTFPAHPIGNDSLLKLGNLAMRNGDHATAIRNYSRALLEEPGLSKTILANLAQARQKYRAERKCGSQPRAAVCVWDLSHNAAGRAYTLATLYEKFADVDMIGSIFPKKGREIWGPIRNTDIRKYYFIVEEEVKFIQQAIELVLEHPYDIVHLSKPRAPNIIFGALYKLVWDAKVLMDIDDEELAFVDAQTPITFENYFKNHDLLPALSDLSGQQWTRLAVGMANEFDGTTVSNLALQKRYGGTIVRHARDERLFKQTPERQSESRKKYGIPLHKKVVLFFGTPRTHKGLVSIAVAISSLQRNDVLFLIVGTFPDIGLKTKLIEICGSLVTFLDDQPFDSAPEIVALGDICVLMQDAHSEAAAFQVPAKMSEALAMGLTVLVTRTPALLEQINSGVVFEVNEVTLGTVLAGVIDSDMIRTKNRAIGEQYFLSNFSLSAQSHDIEALACETKGCDTSSNNLISLQNYLLNEYAAAEEPKWPSIVVYTCNFGGYEAVREPLAIDTRVKYILFTDDPTISSEKWAVVHIDANLEDSRRASRLAKILSHKYLPNHDISLYIDSSMELIESDIVKMASACMENSEIALYKHYKRNCVYDEIAYVQSTLRKVNDAKIAKFTARLKSTGFPEQHGLFENGMIFRKNTAKINELNELWWREYEFGAERDQFSLVYCLWKLRISANSIKIGTQVRVNPYINFYQHQYVNKNVKTPIYAFIAYAPEIYEMNLGRCYNDYMNMVPDDAYVIFIDHDAVILHPNWLGIVDSVISKHKGETALFVAPTNRINNPYQRLNLLEHNHQLADNTQYANIIAAQYGAATSECANWPSSSGVVLLTNKSSWKKHKFEDGFLKVDNKNHISYRAAGDKVYLMDGLYAYHFYRADNDFSHAVRTVKKQESNSAPMCSNVHKVRNFIVDVLMNHDIDRYMQLLQPEQSGVFIPSRAMFCSKDWYIKIEKALIDDPAIGLMIFNGNDKDDKAPIGGNVIDHRNYARSLAIRVEKISSVDEGRQVENSRAFMISKKLWIEFYSKRKVTDAFSLFELYRFTHTVPVNSVKINHVYVLDAAIDHGTRIMNVRNRYRKRVAILTMGFWPALAGMEMMVHNLATKLTEAGDLVVLFTPKPKIEFEEINHSYLLIRFSDLENMKKKFREFHSSMPFDLLYVQGAFEPASIALELKKELGVPVVLRTHGEDIQIDEEIGYGYRIDKYKNRIITENICCVDHNIVIGPHILPEIKKITGRNEVTLIYNGVDVDHFTPRKSSHIQQVFNIPQDTKVLLMVGRNIKKKTLHLAIDALAILKAKSLDVVLVHVGKPGNGENLINYAKALGVSDYFFEMGVVNYFEMPSVYNSADIFVFPSKVETFGNVTMEAMACGLPCVEFDYIVNREKIAHGSTGYIFTHGDVESMAFALEKLINDSSRCSKFGAAARDRAESLFSWWIVCDQYRRLFQNVTDRADRNKMSRENGHLIASLESTSYVEQDAQV